MNAVNITPSLLAQLLTVRPSVSDGLEYRPCLLRMLDGTEVDKVYVVEVDSFERHWGDEPRPLVPLQEVSSILESPSRIDPSLANKLYAGGESGMGYYAFQVLLMDGRLIDCLTGGAVDFLDLPSGVNPTMVKDVFPNSGIAKINVAGRISNSDYAWCLFGIPNQ
jgi:hypothetical protein